MVSAHSGLEVEQVRNQERAVEAEDALSGCGCGQIFDDKGLLRHREILVRVARAEC